MISKLYNHDLTNMLNLSYEFGWKQIMLKLCGHDIISVPIIKTRIKLKRDKQLFYRSIYSLGLEELKTLKVYIKTHLKSKLI